MIITRTPFRMSFFGGGTDYPAWYEKHGGAVLSVTINKFCYITCRYLPPFFDNKYRFVWSKIELAKNIDHIQHPAFSHIVRFTDIEKGIEVHHDADLPSRSGLGSSSSFTVGLLHALNALKGKVITKRQLALDAIHVEQKIMKESVGSQDQVAAAFGGLNKIEFGGSHTLSVNPITIGHERLNELQNHLMLFFTGLSRNASEIAIHQINNIERKTDELHLMREIVDQATDILTSSDNLEEFGVLLHETWKLKRGLSLSITTPFIDEIYEAGMSAGASGGKLLGAGGGGFMLFFVKPESQPHVREKLKNLLYVPFRFDGVGSQIVYYSSSEDSQ
ncbi:MAG: kinase [Candidatus Harrisonbacteria bacterium RIFCSPLOWO2_01_FULL_40_28]|uniref:Kinase n=2 Tax=Candidatus Harrisoniibacteriota TaxID=1817905 RepID=A0A1G1ZUP0_9BACT|nr:MAG: kinase [Candidatus Harrisonbacteria bacterium RIFCSPLOWO2_01_FULL_40_28]OGY68438.1 MAG: kinase [Candidatus Harrisonbacteria bacterium RIFOXYD1_FULL_40_9]